MDVVLEKMSIKKINDFTVWQTLAFIQKLLLEDKMVTQREVYYCLVQHFSSQNDFNNTLQGEPFLHLYLRK